MFRWKIIVKDKVDVFWILTTMKPLKVEIQTIHIFNWSMSVAEVLTKPSTVAAHIVQEIVFSTSPRRQQLIFAQRTISLQILEVTDAIAPLQVQTVTVYFQRHEQQCLINK